MDGCRALRLNSGLYTQCEGECVNGSKYCDVCNARMSESSSGVPEYGTVDDRVKVGLYEFKDPSGRSPTAYTLIMKKHNISKEDVMSGCECLGVSIQSEHLDYVAPVSKRGRPCLKKEVSKPSAGRGRPKKKFEDNVDDDQDDLFNELIKKANQSCHEVDELADELSNIKLNTNLGTMEECELKEPTTKPATVETTTVETATKPATVEPATVEPATKPTTKPTTKATTKPATKAKEEDEDEKEDECKKIIEDGVSYVRSINTGIVYDYESVIKHDDPVVVGKWDDSESKIIFKERDVSEEEDVSVSE